MASAQNKGSKREHRNQPNAHARADWLARVLFEDQPEGFPRLTQFLQPICDMAETLRFNQRSHERSMKGKSD
jgi:hypothetical protein